MMLLIINLNQQVPSVSAHGFDGAQAMKPEPEEYQHGTSSEKTMPWTSDRHLSVE